MNEVFKDGYNALIFSGGGSLGAYEIGVWAALRELEIKIHFVAGTSVGALNAAMVAADDFLGAVLLWQNLTTDMVFDISVESSISEKAFTNKAGTSIHRKLAGMPREEALSYAKEIVINHGVGCTNLHNLLKKTVDEEKVRNSNTDYGLVTTAFPSFKGSYLFIDEIPQGRLHEYLLASASCFPATHWAEIDGQKYIDGGYCDNMPVKMALEKDATNIIAVDLEAVGLLDKGSLKEAASIHGEFKIIKSPWGLGNFLFFSPKNSNYIMNIGYLDTMKMFNRYDGCSYTFKKNTVPPRLISRMDNAAKIFWINPLEIYDQNSFDTALRKNIEVFKASTAIPSVQHMESLKKSTLIGALTALKNRIDRQSLVLMIASNLAAKGSESIFLSRQAFSLLHDEIMAASYIYSKNFF